MVKITQTTVTALANSHATSCIERARWVLEWTTIGQIAIAIALLGFNDLGRSVTPIFLFRNIFYLQLSPHCPKMNKKSMWVVKKISSFLSKGHGILPSCGWKARGTMASSPPPPFFYISVYTQLASGGGKDLSNDSQFRVIGRIELEICTKMLKKLTEKLGAKFPATTPDYSMVKITRLVDVLFNCKQAQ